MRGRYWAWGGVWSVWRGLLRINGHLWIHYRGRYGRLRRRRWEVFRLFDHPRIDFRGWGRGGLVLFRSRDSRRSGGHPRPRLAMGPIPRCHFREECDQQQAMHQSCHDHPSLDKNTCQIAHHRSLVPMGQWARSESQQSHRSAVSWRASWDHLRHGMLNSPNYSPQHRADRETNLPCTP